MLGRTDSRLRLVVLLSALSIMAGVLGLRLAYWQLGQGPELRRMAEAQLERPAQVEVMRGDILDRRGNVLATTAYRDLLAAYPDLLPPDPLERAAQLDRLAEILELGSSERDSLAERLADDSRYVVVSRQLTEQQSELVRAALQAGELSALDLEPQPVRFYPSAGGSPGTTLASQLLGFVTDDGAGRYGIEQATNDFLAPDSAAVAAAADAAGLPTNGGNVQLTIDASLQLRLEKELYAAWVADRAKRVTGVVMDPYTGAVLAWASVPGYDANDYGATADTSPDLFVDPIVSQVYEPGSVMKMFTAAAALDKGVVGLETPVEDAKVLRFGDDVVRNSDRKSMGLIPFQDAIAHSRNVATGVVAMMLGATTDDAAAELYAMWDRLGIGRATGIELGNESAGLVANPTDKPWQAIDLVNRAFGQGVAVTPLQLVAAFSAMVNGGALPQPHVVLGRDGATETPPPAQQVIDAELSEQLRRLMVHVVEAGPRYAEETLIPGYVVGGKTGTAQIWDNDAGRWLDNIYNHTFVGFVGATRPEAVILVRVHDTEPRVKRRGGMQLEVTSNELFRRVAIDAVEVLGIEPLAGMPGLETPPPDGEPTPEELAPDDTPERATEPPDASPAPTASAQHDQPEPDGAWPAGLGRH